MKLLKKFFKTIKGIFRHKKKKKGRRSVRRAVQRSRKVRVRISRKRKIPAKKKKLARAKPLKRVKPKKASAAKAAPAKTKAAKQDQDPGVWVGEITHYFSKIMVVVVKMRGGPLHVRDRIRLEGQSTNFTQVVESMQIESVDVKSARRGQLVGLKTVKPARPGDKVFKLRS